MKIIPTAVHGVLDYLSAVTLFVLPRMMGWETRTTTVLTVLAVGTLVYSLLTRYELGLARVLPMIGHLALDFLSGAFLCAAPFLFLHTDRNATMILVSFGIFEIVVSLLTRTHSTVEQSRQGAQAPTH